MLNHLTLFELSFHFACFQTAKAVKPACRGFLVAALLMLVGVNGQPEPNRPMPASLIAPAKTCPNRAASGGKVAMAKARKSMIAWSTTPGRKASALPDPAAVDLVIPPQGRGHPCAAVSRMKPAEELRFLDPRSGLSRRRRLGDRREHRQGSGSLGDVRSIFIARMKSKGHREDPQPDSPTSGPASSREHSSLSTGPGSVPAFRRQLTVALRPVPGCRECLNRSSGPGVGGAALGH